MIRINLLPVRQTRKFEAARWELLLALAGGVAVILLGAAGWGWEEYSLDAVQAENTALQAEIDRLADDVKRVDEMEKFKAELERKLSVIDDLRSKKTGPVHMLEELSTATPEKLQLTKMEEQGGDVRIEGVAVSNDVISQFLRALDASPYFEQVFLEDIEAMAPDKNQSVTLKTFKLTARLVTPPAAVPKPAGDAPAGASAPGAPVPADGAAPAPTDPAAPAPAPAAPAPAPAEAPPAAPAPAAPTGGGA